MQDHRDWEEHDQRIKNLGSRFCHLVEKHPEMTNATARIGAWLASVQIKLGHPLRLSYRQIKDGFERGDFKCGGTGSRAETIRASMDWLESHGYVECFEDKPVKGGGGLPSKNYTMVI